jgi:hypothetical protein
MAFKCRRGQDKSKGFPTSNLDLLNLDTPSEVVLRSIANIRRPLPVVVLKRLPPTKK